MSASASIHRVAPLRKALAFGIAAALTIGAPSVDSRESTTADARAPASDPVNNCNDAGAGSLRSAIGSAVDGDTIDLTGLACSSITLTTGALVANAANITIVGPGAENLVIDGNDADRVFTHSGVGTLAISGIAVKHGYVASEDPYTTVRGGCIESSGTIALDNATVSDCTVQAYHFALGGCMDSARASIANSRVSGCLAAANGGVDHTYAYGGGIAVLYGVDIAGSLIENNSATASPRKVRGGALFIGFANYALNASRDLAPQGQTVSLIQDSTFSGNSAVGGTYTINLSSYKRNVARGGAIFSSAQLVISGSTFSQNTAAAGGAIWLSVPNTCINPALQITNSTLSGNSATLAGGIGVYGAACAMNLSNSTVAFNSALYAGGILPRHWFNSGYYDHEPEFQSTIVSSNVATAPYSPVDIYAPNISPGALAIVGANNLIGASSVSTPADTLTGDPMLAPLADNGGPTKTLALMTGSPAIDTGNNAAALEFDQRGQGYPRVVARGRGHRSLRIHGSGSGHPRG